MVQHPMEIDAFVLLSLCGSQPRGSPAVAGALDFLKVEEQLGFLKKQFFVCALVYILRQSIESEPQLTK